MARALWTLSVVAALMTASADPSFAENDDGAVFTTPLVTHDSIYVGTRTFCVYAYDRDVCDPNGCTESIRWGYETGAQVLSNPSLGACRADSTLVYQSPVPTHPMLSPQIVDFDCIFVGSDDGHVYALDAETGTCAWRKELGGLVQSQPLVSDEEIFAASLTTGPAHLFALPTYPSPEPPATCACPEEPLDDCCLELDALWSSAPGATRFDPFHPLDASGAPILDRIVIGTGETGDPKGLALVDAATGAVDEDRVWTDTAFNVSAVQDGALHPGRIYVSGGNGETDPENKIVSIRVTEPGHDALEPVLVGSTPWLIERGSVYPNLQVHRSQPVLGESGETLYQGNRTESDPDGKKLFAFDTSDASQKWAFGQADPQALYDIKPKHRTGFVASAARACTVCQRKVDPDPEDPTVADLSVYHPDPLDPGDPCGTCDDPAAGACPEGFVETIFIGNKAKRFFAVMDCGGSPELKWMTILAHNKIRATPAVAGDKVYVGTDADANSTSKFYGLDIETGRIDLEYSITPPGGGEQCQAPVPTTECYISPIPTVIELNGAIVPIEDGEGEVIGGCTTAETVRLAAFFFGPSESAWDENPPQWVNETPGGAAPVSVGCPFGCWADVALVADEVNTVTVAFRDQNGRKGATRVSFVQQEECGA